MVVDDAANELSKTTTLNVVYSSNHITSVEIQAKNPELQHTRVQDRHDMIFGRVRKF
jgi:hypothetical protein